MTKCALTPASSAKLVEDLIGFRHGLGAGQIGETGANQVVLYSPPVGLSNRSDDWSATVAPGRQHLHSLAARRR